MRRVILGSTILLSLVSLASAAGEKWTFTSLEEWDNEGVTGVFDTDNAREDRIPFKQNHIRPGQMSVWMTNLPVEQPGKPFRIAMPFRFIIIKA